MRTQGFPVHLVSGAVAAALFAGTTHAQVTGGDQFGMPVTSGSGTGGGSAVGLGGGAAGGSSGLGGGGLGASGGSLISGLGGGQLAPTLAAGSLGGQGLAGSVAGPTGTSSGVSTSNSFAQYFGNPQGGGLTVPSANARFATATAGRFGAPLYNITAQRGIVGVSISGLNLGNRAAFGGQQQGRLNAGLGPLTQFTSDFAAPLDPSVRLQASLSNVIARSSSLSSRRGIQVQVMGNTVVLRGAVANERERRLAEDLLWLTPGVSEVRNDLTVR